MFRNLRNTIVSLLSIATLIAVPLGVPALAAADGGTNIQSSLCGGATLTVDGTGNCADDTSSTKLDTFIKDLVDVFSVIVGVVAVIMIIFGGFRYITSGGDSNNISGAKNTIIYAVIGLVVVALAQFIVQFVLNKVGNL
jgi:hypothetical protein